MSREREDGEAVVRSFLSRSGLIGASAVLGAAAGAALQVLLARSLSAGDFGRISAMLAAAVIVGPLLGLGLPGYLIASFGQDSQRGELFGTAVVRYLALTGVACCVGLGLVASIWRPTVGEALVLSYGLGQSFTEIEGSAAQVQGQSTRVAWAFLWPHILRVMLVLGAFVLLGSVSSTAVGCIILIVALVQLAVASRALKHVLSITSSASRRGGERQESVAAVAQWAIPFGFTGIAFYLLVQGPITALRSSSTGEQVALLSVCMTVLSAAYILPNVVFQRVLMMRLHSLWSSAPDVLRTAFGAAAGLSAITGTVVGFLLAVVGPFGLPLAFGAYYEEAATALVIVSVAVPLRYLSVCTGAFITVVSRQHAKASWLAFSGIVGSVVALSLGSRFGAVGAAFGYVVGEVMLCFGYLALLAMSSVGALAVFRWRLTLPTELMQIRSNRD